MKSVYRDAIKTMAGNGASPEEIMKSLGCSRQTVYTHWPPGIPTMHQREEAKKAEDFETVVMLTQKGWSQAKIAQKLNMNISRVHRVVSRYNAAITDNGPGRGVSPPPPPTRRDE